jgi:hypothetical protein
MQYPTEVFHDTNDMYCELHSTGMEAGLVVFGSVTVLVTIVMQGSHPASCLLGRAGLTGVP